MAKHVSYPGGIVIEGGIDAAGAEIKNVLLQNLGSDPTAVEAKIYWNTVSKKVRIHNGTAWVNLGDLDTEAVQDILGAMIGTVSGITVTYDDPTGKLNFTVTDSPTVAGTTPAQLRDRSTHTGTQLASTISNFDTQVRSSRLDQMAAATAPLTAVDPTLPAHLATKSYVDAMITGWTAKQPVRASTTANITLSGLQSVDGVTLLANDRVLVKDQTTGSQNGIYLVASGAWTRATDADASSEVKAGLFVIVTEGTNNGDKAFLLTTNDPITLGTTSLTFTALPGGGSAYLAGNGLNLSGSTFSVVAGAGISVGANVAVDATVARTVYFTIGDAAAVSFTLAHALGKNTISYAIREIGTGKYWDAEVTRVDNNNITVAFATAPSAAQFEVVVIG